MDTRNVGDSTILEFIPEKRKTKGTIEFNGSNFNVDKSVTVSGLKSDTISEKTLNAGVTIDGVTIKDGAVLTETAKVVTKTKEVALSAADLIAMYTTPIVVVAAPGAGYVATLKSALLIYDSTATAFTAGGAITINYAGGAAQSSSLAATFLTGAGDKVWNLEKLNAANGLTQLVNTGLTITNATQAFATGTGVCRLQITYSIHETGL